MTSALLGVGQIQGGGSHSNKIANLKDTFTGTTLDSQWKVINGSATVDNQLQLACGYGNTGYCFVTSTSTWDLTSSSFYFEQTPPPVGNGSTEWSILLETVSSTANEPAVYFDIGEQFGGVRAGYYNGTTYYVIGTVAINADSAWLQIAQSGSLVTWSSAPDGVTWTTIGTYDTTISLTALYATFACGFDTSGNAASTGIISYINELPPPPTGVPVIQTDPVVSGLLVQGDVLTTTNGSWTQSPTSYTYQWYNSGTGRISGATSATYDSATGDVGDSLNCEVIATNSVGHSTEATSNSVGPITAPTGGSNPSGVAPPTAGAYSGFTQAFVDDFTGTELNTDVWVDFITASDSYGPWEGTQGSVGGSMCTMVNSIINGFDGTTRYGTATQTIAEYTQGITLVMAQCSPGAGLTMCLGMIPNGEQEWPPEIDFYEDMMHASTSARTQTCFSVHYGPDGSNDMDYTFYGQPNGGTPNIQATFDGSDWNIWGVEWNPSTISFLLNPTLGVTGTGVVWSIANPSPGTGAGGNQNPMVYFMQNELNDTTNGTPGSVTTTMNVDWVAIYVPS